MSLEVLAVDFDFLGSLEFADEVSRHLQASETFSVSCFRVQTEEHLGLYGGLDGSIESHCRDTG